jgi:hypothetical protein
MNIVTKINLAPVVFAISLIGLLGATGLLHAQLLPQYATQAPSISNTAGTWNSSIVYKGPDGALVYHSDDDFNRIPDFSYAGYRGGGVPLPNVPVRITLNPSPTGNDIEQIQQAWTQSAPWNPMKTVIGEPCYLTRVRTILLQPMPSLFFELIKVALF